ncbi:8313_t:CDS:2, partial [Gigaspora rosea]
MLKVDSGRQQWRSDQKRKKNEQDASSAAPKKKFGIITKNRIMLHVLHEDYNATQEDHKDYNTTQENYEDNNISSRVSLLDDESDNSS